MIIVATLLKEFVTEKWVKKKPSNLEGFLVYGAF